jgi:DNA invertase Pin-like site-specific DNA recombinase
VIVVYTLDRLGRTVRDTLNLIHELAESVEAAIISSAGRTAPA